MCIPDVSFISWQQLPGRNFPDDAIASLYPDLAVEVVSAGNTPGEMRRKLKDYFAAGTQIVWFIYPKTKSHGSLHWAQEAAVGRRTPTRLMAAVFCRGWI